MRETGNGKRGNWVLKSKYSPHRLVAQISLPNMSLLSSSSITRSMFWRNITGSFVPTRVRPGTLYPHIMSTLSDGHHSIQNTTTKTVRVVVKGRVQGVFYRNWTIENANELGLRGWVRNRRDGSVEALFSGSPDKVQDMEQRCRRGPPAAMVTALEVSPCSDDPGTGFDRRQTI